MQQQQECPASFLAALFSKVFPRKLGVGDVIKTIRMTNTPVPMVLVILAALLLSCNVLWLYTTPSNQQRSVCGYLVDSWSAGRAGGDPTNTSAGVLVGRGAPPPPAVHDYQLVRGNGLSDVPVPLPIPNDTVLLGEDLGVSDGLRLRYLTVGIASVWRKEEYLFRTIESLLKETSSEDKKEVFIFLLLADADPDFRIHRAKELYTRYKQHVDSGMLRVLQPPALLYPNIDFSTIRRTYNDSVGRVQWRTKQVLDFAFLFWYTWSRQPSTYYLILEDDVLSARHFVTAVRDFVNLHGSRHWVALQLSGFMGIGQLIRCKDMDRLVSFLLLFYREHPVDVLFTNWVSMMAPQKPPKDCPYRRVPGLFQHVGIHSTLANKTQPLRDSTFSLVRRRYSHVNPPADVVTTIRQYKSFVAGLAYSSAPGMFWGIPRAGDTYDIVFGKPMLVDRIVVITGAAVTKKKVRDRLLFGQLQVSHRFQQMLSPHRAFCEEFIPIKEFREGEVDAKGLGDRFPNGIQCVRIVVGSKQRTWISISEIAIFSAKKTENGSASDGSEHLGVRSGNGEETEDESYEKVIGFSEVHVQNKDLTKNSSISIIASTKSVPNRSSDVKTEVANFNILGSSSGSADFKELAKTGDEGNASLDAKPDSDGTQIVDSEFASKEQSDYNNSTNFDDLKLRPTISEALLKLTLSLKKKYHSNLKNNELESENVSTNSTVSLYERK